MNRSGDIGPNPLRSAEERYLELINIFDSMLDPVHITNKDLEIEFVNRACSEIFGPLTPGVRCYKYFHDFKDKCAWCMHGEVMQGRSYKSENYFEKTKTYFDANHSPLTKADGEIAKLVILRDVTDRKAVEQLLKKRNEEKDALIEAIRTVLFQKPFKTRARIIFEECRRLIKAEAGYVALLNKDKAENEVIFVDSGGIPCTVDPSLPMSIRGLRERVYSTGKTIIENDFGTSRWMQFMPEGHVQLECVMFVPMRMNNRTVGLIGLANKAGGFTEEDASLAYAFGELAAIALQNSIMHDAMESNIEALSVLTGQLKSEITERKAAEESLRDSEGRYRTLVSNIEKRHFIYHHDINGVFTYLSPSITDILGYSPKDFMCHYTTYLTDNPVNHRVKDFTYRSLLGESQPPYELEIYHKDGGRVWLEVVELPVFDNEGNVTGIQGVAQDVSERKKAQEAIIAAGQVEAMRKLILGLLHGIRNPLFGITSIGQILQKEIEDGKHRSLIRAMNGEARRISSLMSELSMYANPKSPRAVPTDAESFIENILSKYRELYPNVAFRAKIGPPLSIYADQDMLYCAVGNLLENSCQAGATEIDIEAFISEGRTTLCITDNGKGMAEKDLEKCFEPFYTTKQGSTGLGLSLSKKLVETQGGFLSISRQKDKGISAIITI